MCSTRKVIFRGQVSETCTSIRTWLILHWIWVRQDDFCSQNSNLCLEIGETHDDANENSKFCDCLQASCKFSCIFLLIFATTLVFSWQKTLIFSSSSSHYRWYRWSRFWIHSSIEYSVFKKYRYLSINRFSATA